MEIIKLGILYFFSLFTSIIKIKLQKKFGMLFTKKYIVEDAGTQKYATGNFRKLQMIEDKDVSSQIHDYHMLVNDLVIEDIKLP